LFAAGSVGALTRPVVFALLFVMAIASVRYLRELWLLVRRTPIGVFLVLFAGSALTFLRALYPPTGWDATAYHLPYARLFAEEGSLVYAGFLRFPVFPQLDEMLFTASLLAADDVTAQLTQWLCLVITAAALAAIDRTLLAAAIWCSIPLVSWLGSQAYVDCGLTMAVTLAFVAWIQWRSTDHAGWAVVIGAFAGMAAATKYHGLFFVVFFGFTVIAVSGRRARDAALFLLGVIITAAPWYLRIAAWTGNPLFPYFGNIFGPNDWGLTLYQSRQRMGMSLYNLRLWIPAMLPAAAAGAFLDRRVRFLFLGAVAYVIAVWTLDSRFMVVSIPLLAVCAAAAVPPRLRRILVLVALLPGIVVGWRELRRFGSIPRTAAERHAFLETRIWPYGALRFLATPAGTRHTVYVLHGENAAYYAQGRQLGDRFGPYRDKFIMPLFRRPDRLARVLRSFGAEYFIVRPGVFDPGSSGALERVYASADAEVFRVRSGE